MTEEKQQKETQQAPPPSNDTKSAPLHTNAGRGRGRAGAPGGGRQGERSGRPQRRGRGGRRGDDRTRSEFEQKIISLRRVVRVVAGGRRFSFSAAIVAGDKKGRVGVGVGKGADTALAMNKAFRDAQKNMIKVNLTESKSIPHDVEAKYTATRVALRPAPARGIVAGSSVRTVLEFAGVTDVTTKLNSRSKNKLNNARATIEALKDLHT